MPDPLPPWRALLRGARQREVRSPQARWLQLATVAADGTPRVRTLVFRGWGGAASLDLLTDGRSAKAEELRRQPAVELCWLLPRARCQFRLRGAVEPLPMPSSPPEQEQQQRALQQHWLQLTPAGRALWAWPPPGEPLDPEAVFADALPPESPRPAHFQLLRCRLEQVELLELAGVPHRRCRWRRSHGWQEEQLNP
jgi:pyridoxamine 5'-phosphate oxidase